MKILDGKTLASKIIDDVREELINLKKQYKRAPGLAVILVGSDVASKTYVNMKKKACEYVGIYSITHDMPEDTPFDTIIDTVNMMNVNNNIDGILVQLPLPKSIDSSSILALIDPSKDVDGFHALNIGKVMLNLGGFSPCTPLGVLRILDEYNITLKSKDVCIIGSSNIVGKPLASLLLNAGATVDICHIHTKNLNEHTKRADIVFVGVGKEKLIKADMLKDGVVVVDIGINKNKDGKLVGDVDFDEVGKKASYITPVPGGVGPMTIAMLLKNTLESFKSRIKS